MSMFGKFGDMFRLQRDAKRIKEQLSRIHIEAETDGVKVVVNGNQTVVSVEVIHKGILQHDGRLCRAMKDAMNKALEKAQKVAAEHMKPIMGGMGFPGT